MLRNDTKKVMLRFAENRPLSDITAQFLEWVSQELHKEGYVWLVKEPHQQCATCYFRDEDVFQKVQDDLGKL